MPKTLLLADDSVVIQKLVALSFANEDIELVTVYNGDDAVAKASECRPDVVLADVVMPGRNGYEVCEAIKRDPQLAHVPVLLLTGTFEAFDDERARQAGSDGQITKPFEAQALVERVNELLARGAAATPMASDAAPSVATPEPSTSYDFFDDDLGEPLAESGPLGSRPAADDASFGSSDNSFAFGDDGGAEPTPIEAPSIDPLAPISGDDDPLAGMAPSLDVPSDHTVALLPDEDAPVGATTGDAATVTASRIESPLPAMDFDSPAPAPAPTPAAGLDTPPPAVDFGAPSEPDPAETVLADAAFAAPNESFEPIASPGQNANPDPFGTGLDDDLSLGGPAATPEAPSIDAASDAFAPPAPASDDGLADELEFGFASTPPAGLDAAPDLQAMDASTPPPEAQLDPAGSSAFDVSFSDLGDPLAAGPQTATPPPMPTAAPSPSPPPVPQPEAPVAAAPPAVPPAPFAVEPPALPEAPIAAEPPAVPFAAEPPAVPPAPIAPEAMATTKPEAELPPAPEPMVAPEPAFEAPVAEPTPAMAPPSMEPAMPPAPEPAPAMMAPPADPMPDPAPMPVAEPSPAFESPAEPDFAAPAMEPAAEPMPPSAPEPEAAPVFPEPAEPIDAGGPSPAEPVAPLASEGLDLSDVMRDRIHETLEKVAWEAFADLSETIVRQVLERVERVAWEVVPQMAETLIQEEIRKLKDDSSE